MSAKTFAPWEFETLLRNDKNIFFVAHSQKKDQLAIVGLFLMNRPQFPAKSLQSSRFYAILMLSLKKHTNNMLADGQQIIYAPRYQSIFAKTKRFIWVLKVFMQILKLKILT